MFAEAIFEDAGQVGMFASPDLDERPIFERIISFSPTSPCELWLLGAIESSSVVQITWSAAQGTPGCVLRRRLNFEVPSPARRGSDALAQVIPLTQSSKG